MAWCYWPIWFKEVWVQDKAGEAAGGPQAPSSPPSQVLPFRVRSPRGRDHTLLWPC